MDHVDFVTRLWTQERPDLDVSAMAIVGRLTLLSAGYGKEMQKTFARFGLNQAKFDVLATLRRAGPPYALSPGDLLQATMVASGTMTNRIDKLELDGLVLRQQNPADSRSVLIGLTDKGRTLIDQALEAHVITQAGLVSGLSEAEQQTLTALLSKALIASNES